jgi:hypothetical protein
MAHATAQATAPSGTGPAHGLKISTSPQNIIPHISAPPDDGSYSERYAGLGIFLHQPGPIPGREEWRCGLVLTLVNRQVIDGVFWAGFAW